MLQKRRIELLLPRVVNHVTSRLHLVSQNGRKFPRRVELHRVCLGCWANKKVIEEVPLAFSHLLLL